MLFFGLFAALLSIVYLLRRDGPERGSDVRLRLPLRICPQCAAKLSEYLTLEEAVLSAPAYAELYQKYPQLELLLDAEKKKVNLSQLS